MSMDILQEKIRKMKNPSMVGLDPTPEVVPDWLIQESMEEYGETFEALAKAYYRFCSSLLHALVETIPAVKIQTACFEVLGASGVAVMQTLCEEAKELGYYVVLDAMRSDVSHIAELYASAVFGKASIGKTEMQTYPCDAVTLNGYCGSDSVLPYLPYCRDCSKSVFLMVKSSNRSGREVQDLISGDRVVHTAMADLAMRWSNGLFGKNGYSQIGVIMPANNASSVASMRKRYDRLFFLVTGYGAQGGTARHASGAFDQFGHGAVISASRSIIGAWKKAETDGKDYLERALEAAVKMKKDIAKFVTVI